MDCNMPSFPVPHHLPEPAQTHVHWLGDAIQPSHPLSSPSPPDFNLSQHQGLFKWVSFLNQITKLLEFQLQRQSFQSIQDWFPLGWTIGSLAVQGTLKSLLQHHSSKHQFFGAFFLYSPTLTSIHDHWKTIALNRWTFVGKVVSLFFNMLSSLVITFLPRSKCLLILWLQSPSKVILETPKIKSLTVSTVSPSFAMKWSDQMPWS